jgi:3,4-dihydroxy-2-butanone 4-phosphate synthase
MLRGTHSAQTAPLVSLSAARQWRAFRCRHTGVRLRAYSSLEVSRTATHAAASTSKATCGASKSSVNPVAFSNIEDAVAAIAAGEFVLVLDDEDRENEGDLIIAADKVTPEKIAYMVEYTSGALAFLLVAWRQCRLCSGVPCRTLPMSHKHSLHLSHKQSTQLVS